MSRLPVSLTSAAVLLLAPAPALAQPAPAPDPLAGFQDFAARVLESWGAPGLAVAVVKDGKVVLEEGFGTLLAGGGDPVDAHTVFAIASTSKAFTAATLGTLVDDGRLSWDDPVVEHLPTFRLHDPWVTREMTVRDLLSHRSGLPRGDHLWYLSALDREAVVARAALLEPASSFRSRYGYQNIMFITAGEVAEAVTGATWDELVEGRIFRPLGMERSTTTTQALVGMENVATPHVRLDGAVVPIAWPDFDNVGAAGAINASVHDLSRWLRAQLGGGTVDGTTLWSDSVAREMWEPNTVVPLGAETRRTHPETHLQSYGLGWFLQDYRGRLVVRHGGSLDGMRAHVALVPEEGLGVVALTNLNESRIPVAVVWDVIDRYLPPREEPRDWNAVLLAEAERDRKAAEERRAEAEAERVAGTRPSLPREAYAGRYESPLGGRLEVTREGEGLQVSWGPNYVGELSHWHYDTWRVTWRNRSLGTDQFTFRVGASGRVEILLVPGVGGFRRVGDGGS